MAIETFSSIQIHKTIMFIILFLVVNLHQQLLFVSARHLFSTTTSAASTTVIHQYLDPHNALRSKLGLPPLEWSEKLAQYASSWANKRRQECELIHSNTDYGENLFWGSGGDWKPADAVAEWGAEKCHYDYRSNRCVGGACLHYTQMVWKHSRKVGCARTICRSGDTFITCNYDPHGNVVGQKPF